MNIKNSKYSNENKKYLKNSRRQKSPQRGVTFTKVLFATLIVLIIITGYFMIKPTEQKELKTPVVQKNEIWKIRSIDTMKTSRDKARDGITDDVIKAEVSIIKSTGANYVAIGTPYDNEFLPYLKKWVSEIRRQNLNVWFRGSFANYEGWFEYEKNLTPDALLLKTEKFISENKELFEDGDIFDPCPECENGGFWPQPQGDPSYNIYVQKKHEVLKKAFNQIDKKVIYNLNSIIGGRAKDVLKQPTFNALDNVIAIDHYNNNAQNYSDYIDYFTELNTKVVFSEFGAPIPDMHGKMSEDEQAKFIDDVMFRLFQKGEKVKGLNYWVLSTGTTALINENFSERKALSVLKNYYYPSFIKGTITDTLDNPLLSITVKIENSDVYSTTDQYGNYSIAVPSQKEYTVIVDDKKYLAKSEKVRVEKAETKINNMQLVPKTEDIWYKIQKVLD
jgi:hypothetical protein